MHCCTKSLFFLSFLRHSVCCSSALGVSGLVYISFAPAFAFFLAHLPFPFPLPRGLTHDQRVQLLFQEVVRTFIFIFILLELLALGPDPFGCSCGFLCVSHCVHVLIDPPSCRTLPPLHPATGAMFSKSAPHFFPGLLFLITIFLSWSPLAWCQWTC